MAPVWKKASFVLYVVVVVAIGTEIACQFLVPRSDRAYIFPPYERYMHLANQEYTPGIHTDARFMANSLGIRSDEPPPDAKRRLLLFGGSTGLDQVIDQDKTWAQLLQARLNSAPGDPKTWVGNLSRSSRASRHNVDYFDVVVPYMPKADLFLDLLGVNDFQLHLKSSFGTYTAEQELSFNFSVLPATDLWDYSGIVRFARKMEDWRRRQKYAFIAGTSGYKQMRDCRQSVPEAAMIGELPDLSAGLDEMRRNLNGLVDRAERYGAPMVFITQPILWGAAGAAERKLLLAGGVGANGEWCKRKEYYTSAALARGLEAYNNVTREVCRARHLFCIDLARLLPAEAQYYMDDMHFNEAGAAKVAEIVAAGLRRWWATGKPEIYGADAKS